MSIDPPINDLERTKKSQRDAADPAASVWVSANAGTGKTHVLTQRVLRLMLAGTKPERILCLTYTKAAAAEMSKRVFDTLASWVSLPDEALHDRLLELNNRAPTFDEVQFARTLFAVAIETPGGLKVQTIHSFCERLLQRFPLEAGVTPGFSVLDDTLARKLLREAIDATLFDVTGSADSGAQAQALAAIIPFASEDVFDKVLANALHQRQWLDSALRIDFGAGPDDEFHGLDRAFRRAFSVREGVTAKQIDDDIADLFDDSTLSHLRDALTGGSKSDQDLAAHIIRAISARSAAARAAALKGYLLTSEGAARKRLMTKGVSEASTGLMDTATDAQTRCLDLQNESRAVRAVEATIALHRLASVVLQRYSVAKMRRAALDYDDLITKSVYLLSGQDLASWVMFKLDRGIDHILVDEAQDTSPEQWQIVASLAREFFTGEGQMETIRTLFGVGDEKQSIYSFQGADPRQFAAMGARFAEMSGPDAWRRIPLDLSFRTVAPILEAVDRVFSDHLRTPGLTADRSRIHHAVHRMGHGGVVELWPPELAEDAVKSDRWAPLEEEHEQKPIARVADRVANTIRSWLDNGEMLASEGRPIRAGDIIILVRKRRPFADPMVAALKARNIPVAGSDRLRLSDQIAVQDLVSLGDFLTLPEDDLALAEVLKSPLIGLDDDDLLAIAHGRNGSLWKGLIAHKGDNERFRTAFETLKRWRSRADFVPPFEFFASILDREGARSRLLARLGSEAADPIDEFLNLALRYDDAEAPSLTGFLTFLRKAESEVKRDMEQGRDEVRVMTVHGAKGLEAPIVFLPDTCGTRSNSGKGDELLTLDGIALPEGTKDKPFVWVVKGTGKHPLIEAAKAEASRRELEERNRLLYVAMTRARDRLYVAGFAGKNGPAAGSWYELIELGLEGLMEKVDTGDGTTASRYSVPQSAAPGKPKSEHRRQTTITALPEWAAVAAPKEAALSIPLAPSRLEAYAPDEEGEALPVQPEHRRPAEEEPAAPSPRLQTSEHRFLRGTLTHALLQHLPTLPVAGWQQAAHTFLELRGDALSAGMRASIAKETLAILTAPQFTDLFGPSSRAEVPIVALIPHPNGRSAPLKLMGQIDRLVDTGSEVLIVDYKTNRPPPRTIETVAPAYLYQLAAYRLALQEIYPGRVVRAALLWTDGPRMMMLPDALLDDYTGRLWNIDLDNLDGQRSHS
ncbi:hypothetical protein APY04_0927 [Hyphomicrobium sulfonivorans]|uniref:DNA 3'-5' helicase n=1 Tax=Hyphomicrobium sulfonivorans TaxID=121290 RepID=A0A120CX97_HYPSL|nr:double-strand break repair helicase AddA [Hyphomicrobium sulfonivorans]KWT70647.1 hypothetical protein APY04_0927 [Hyphomicrobium sulfonivorans]